MHKKALSESDEIWAAVAYVDNQQIQQNNFIKSCFDARIPLTLYARYDESTPVGTDILKWFLDQKSPDYNCFLIPNLLHTKIIWYRPIGIYIGSANLTNKAWNNNIEAGIFMSQLEMGERGLLTEINDYFEFIKSQSYSLTTEIYEHFIKFNSNHPDQTASKQKDFFDESPLPNTNYFDAPESRSNAEERFKANFLKEWNETLQILRDIASIVSTSYRPSWVSTNVPSGVQADQFLHAYYYEKVRPGNGASMHKGMHETNRTRKEQARKEEMKWWASLPTDLHDEAQQINKRAPRLRHLFSKSNILELSEDEFAEAMSMVHAFYAYSRQTSVFAKGFTQSERCKMLAKEVFQEENEAGENVLKLLNYILYGGNTQELPSRIYKSCYDKSRKLPYIGLSTIGEIVGWVLPEIFPPRNGRTSKALYALGYDVKIHTE